MAAALEKKVNRNFTDDYEDGPRRIHIINDGRYYHPNSSAYSQSSSTATVTVVREQYCICTKTERERRLFIACVIFVVIIFALIATIVAILCTDQEAARKFKDLFRI